MKRNLMLPLAAILFMTAVLFHSCDRGLNISQFRGPDRSGIYPDTNLLKVWPENGPPEVFFLDSTGNGYGSPTFVDELIYFTGAVDSISFLYCADLQGNLLWSFELGKTWWVNYPGSRSTPTVAGNLIYVGTGTGDLYCVDRINHKLVWSRSLQNDFQGVVPRFGHAESPVILDDKVFWTAGGELHNVLAINRFTGELLWSNPGTHERSGYHPPRVITVPSDRKVLVTFSAYHLMGLDAETGTLLWTHEQDNVPPEKREPGMGDTHANTVIYEDGAIYYAAGDGNCGIKLSINDDGTSISEAWRNREFDSFMGGIVKLGNYLYGSGSARPLLYSIDARTGILADSLALGRGGVVIAADDMLYYYNYRGEIHLLSYDDNGQMQPVSAFRITKGSGEHFSHPVIHRGILYVRRGNAIMGYDISVN